MPNPAVPNPAVPKLAVATPEDATIEAVVRKIMSLATIANQSFVLLIPNLRSLLAAFPTYSAIFAVKSIPVVVHNVLIVAVAESR